MSDTAAKPTSPARARQTDAEIIAQSGLPHELTVLIHHVSDRTRLWKGEKAEVARELCSHFNEGLESGATVSDLVTSFGDPTRAAALISRAKKRQRPLWWRSMRQSLRATAALFAAIVVLYTAAAARYFLGSPNIARNYMTEINAPVLRIPKEERAWPRYVEALASFGQMPDALISDPLPEKPGDQTWPAYAEWLEAHAPAMATIREAASLPHLGFVLSNDFDPDYVSVLEATRPGYKHSPAPQVENPLLLGILLPHLGEMRRMARWVAADARLAASHGDRVRFLADIEAMLGMARQCLNDQHLIQSLVGVAIFDFARTVAQDNALNTGFLTDADLADLAHRLAGFAGGRIAIDTTLERCMMDDIIQRFYTDDGRGGGHLVSSDETDRLYVDFGVARPKAEPLLTAFGPIQSVTLPSRATLNSLLNAFTDRAAADEALPPWRHDERTADAIFDQIGQSGIYAATPFVQSLQAGQDSSPLAHAFGARDLASSRRDGLIVAISLELYRRRHGAYPASLESLVPEFLPAIPKDPFDGRAMRYLPATSPGGTPTLYSIGVDGRDDSGRPPETKSGRQAAASLRMLKDFRVPREFTSDEQAAMTAARGDWVLWPPPEPPKDTP